VLAIAAGTTTGCLVQAFGHAKREKLAVYARQKTNLASGAPHVAAYTRS